MFSTISSGLMMMKFLLDVMGDPTLFPEWPVGTYMVMPQGIRYAILGILGLFMETAMRIGTVTLILCIYHLDVLYKVATLSFVYAAELYLTYDNELHRPGATFVDRALWAFVSCFVNLMGCPTEMGVRLVLSLCALLYYRLNYICEVPDQYTLSASMELIYVFLLSCSSLGTLLWIYRWNYLPLPSERWETECSSGRRRSSKIITVDGTNYILHRTMLLDDLDLSTPAPGSYTPTPPEVELPEVYLFPELGLSRDPDSDPDSADFPTTPGVEPTQGMTTHRTE